MNARILLPIIASCIPLTLAATPAYAQATRTWVSGVGDDANPCSRTAPCKTFAGAISKTAAGGEINCLDPGGYGAVMITNSITIDCAGTLGSVLAANTNGIVINGPNVVVTLRNISINGAGTGNIGVRLINGASLHISNLTIFGFATANGAGVSIETAGSANVYIDGTTISGNTTGIQIRPTGTPTMMLVNSALTANPTAGLVADGGSARVRVGHTTITGNGVGVRASNGAAVNSYGDNRLNGNTTDGEFTGPAAARR